MTKFILTFLSFFIFATTSFAEYEEVVSAEGNAVSDGSTYMANLPISVTVESIDLVASRSSEGHASKCSCEGEASFYTLASSGPTTASGAPMGDNVLAAANRCLPFNSHARVCNVGNGQCTTVLVNDRGPYAKDSHGRLRVMDLTAAAAKALGFGPHRAGTAQVKYGNCL